MKFKNYINPYSKSNRIYSQNDIANMPVKEAFKREREIVAQDDRIGVPSDMELRNSENVIWVEEYRRDDGTEVKGHWRSKPGRGGITPQDGDEGIISENPVSDKEVSMNYSEDEEWVNFGLEILNILLGETEYGPYIKLFSPLIKILLSKFLDFDDEDDSENANEAPINTQTSTTQFPQDQTPTQNNPTDQNQEQEQTQDKPDIGISTGGASEVKEEDTSSNINQRDIPPMTKSAELQENAIKNMPIWEVKSTPEQEYYRIAFELKKSKETGEIPEWMKEHNDIRTLDKIGNEENKKALEEKIIQGAKDNNDIETLNNLNDVYIITAKPDSNLTKTINNSNYLKKEIDKKISEIESGVYEKSSFPIAFPNSEFSNHNAIGRCDVHNVKVESDGYLSATIIDYYDFDKRSSNLIVKNGYIQQQNGHLSNYALMIPIRIKIKK